MAMSLHVHSSNIPRNMLLNDRCWMWWEPLEEEEVGGFSTILVGESEVDEWNDVDFWSLEDFGNRKALVEAVKVYGRLRTNEQVGLTFKESFPFGSFPKAEGIWLVLVVEMIMRVVDSGRDGSTCTRSFDIIIIIVMLMRMSYALIVGDEKTEWLSFVSCIATITLGLSSCTSQGNMPYGRFAVGLALAHSILLTKNEDLIWSKSDGLTLNGTVYHDTFQFKKSTNIIGSRKVGGGMALETTEANVCEETLDVVGFVIGLINNMTFVNVAIFDGLIEFGNYGGNAGDCGYLRDVGFSEGYIDGRSSWHFVT
ncbi:hypothetical protein Tco_0709157 [Tanacetum coccineum]